MLAAIRDFFEKNLSGPAAGRDEGHAIALATAALLLEVVRMDGDLEPRERDTVLRAVREKFGLAPVEADELVALAEAEARQATDYFQFTSLLNRHFTAEQKVRVIEHMWAVAYADAELSAWEQHLIRKVADLLYVGHGDYVAAKMRARDAAP
jgi:uncharacterized tellurite resistance protein B-like protein